MPRHALVCLANSKKGNGYCFAGVDPQTREWVRPVGSGWDGAVMAAEQALEDGSRPSLLDLVDVPLGARAPEPGQPENWQIEAGTWIRNGCLSPEEARDLLDPLVTVDPIFGTQGKSISPTTMATLAASLEVIHPDAVTWDKADQKKLYAVFEHCGEELSLKVGDPAWVERFRNYPPGSYQMDEASPYLIASVTVHEWHGAHWKLVAGVLGH